MAYPQKKGKYYYIYVKTPDPSKPEGFRYQCHTKDPDSGDRWTTKTAARDWGRARERAVNHPAWVDPQLGTMTWDRLWAKWLPSINVEPNTERQYRYFYDSHIGPRYGARPIGESTSSEVDEWIAKLREGTVETGRPEKRVHRRYARTTTNSIRMLMSMMLDDACLPPLSLLGANPLLIRESPRRGKRVDKVTTTVRPKPVATPREILAGALNMHDIIGAGTIAGMAAFVRVLTAGWTGLRPGEQAALDRRNCNLRGAVPAIFVDDDEGSLEHMPGRDPRLKAPKSGIGREVVLNLGLAALLTAWLDYIDGPVVFPCSPDERWNLRYWGRRWGQARTGGSRMVKRRDANNRYIYPVLELRPCVPNLEYKGLRRIHNVWLTEHGIPDVVRTHRLGHAMDDQLQHAYSQVSRALEAQMLAVLQSLWVEAFSGDDGPAAIDVIRQFAPDFGGRASASAPRELI